MITSGSGRRCWPGSGIPPSPSICTAAVRSPIIRTAPRPFRQAVMSDLAVAAKRFDAAKAVLRRQPTVDGENAAIGYCMGGTIVLHMARVDGPRRRRLYHGGLA